MSVWLTNKERYYLQNVLSTMPDSSKLTSFLAIASARDVLNYTKIPCFNSWVMVITPTLSIREARALSVAELSQHARRALEEQRTPEMLTKIFKWTESRPKWVMPMQEGQQEVVWLSNLVKAGTNTIDLRPAVEQGSGDGRIIHSVRGFLF